LKDNIKTKKNEKNKENKENEENEEKFEAAPKINCNYEIDK